jgi:hypothetical protein
MLARRIYIFSAANLDLTIQLYCSIQRAEPGAVPSVSHEVRTAIAGRSPGKSWTILPKYPREFGIISFTCPETCGSILPIGEGLVEVFLY